MKKNAKLVMLISLCGFGYACSDDISLMKGMQTAENSIFSNANADVAIGLNYEVETTTHTEFLDGTKQETDAIYTTPQFVRTQNKTIVTSAGNIEIEITDLAPNQQVKTNDATRNEKPQYYKRVIRNGEMEVFDQAGKSIGKHNMPTENMLAKLNNLKATKKNSGKANISGKFIGYDADVIVASAKQNNAKVSKINDHVSEIELMIDDVVQNEKKQYQQKIKIDHKTNNMISGELRDKKTGELLHSVAFIYKVDKNGNQVIDKVYSESFQNNIVSKRKEKMTTISEYKSFEIIDNL